MSLSVEHIDQVLSGFESCDLAIYDDAEAPCRGADRIVIDALRELRAIKEAEPVAYIDRREFELLLAGRTHAYTMPQQTVDCDVPLIRKPE